MNPEREIARIQSTLDDLSARVEQAKTFTAQVLAAAERVGATRVGLNTYDDTVYSYGEFAFSSSGSLFCKGSHENGRPLAWKVAEEAGISGGCGNGDQHQVRNARMLIDGIYELRDGVWHTAEVDA